MAVSSLFDYTGIFCDRRLDTRCAQIASSMFNSASAVIQRFSGGRDELVGSCRFFNNDRVGKDELLSGLTQSVSLKAKDKVVLCIEDTTQFDFTAKAGRIKGETLGQLAASYQIGFFLHPVLVMDIKGFIPLGISCAQLWSRELHRADKHARTYFEQPLEEKESFRWIKAVKQSDHVLDKAKHKIIIADREGDIYPLFVRLKNESTDIIVRSAQNRKLASGTSIKEYLKKAAVKTKVKLKVKADIKNNRSSHLAHLEIKFGQVELLRPQTATSTGSDKSFKLYVVQVRESKKTVKRGESAVEWTLLSTLPVRNNEDAHQLILYYSKRWMIEEFFAILKTRGLNLENSQLTNGEALMKLCVLAMDVAIKILQLTKGRENEELSAEIVFSKEELTVLADIVLHYEGATQKQKNAFRKNSLAWSAWIIGRMGGWTSYKSDSPPGNRTMKIGLEKFNTMYTFHLMTKKNVCRD